MQCSHSIYANTKPNIVYLIRNNKRFCVFAWSMVALIYREVDVPQHIHTLHTQQKLRKVKQNPITTLERTSAFKHIFCCLCVSPKLKTLNYYFKETNKYTNNSYLERKDIGCSHHVEL